MSALYAYLTRAVETDFVRHHIHDPVVAERIAEILDTSFRHRLRTIYGYKRSDGYKGTWDGFLEEFLYSPECTIIYKRLLQTSIIAATKELDTARSITGLKASPPSDKSALLVERLLDWKMILVLFIIGVFVFCLMGWLPNIGNSTVPDYLKEMIRLWRGPVP